MIRPTYRPMILDQRRETGLAYNCPLGEEAALEAVPNVDTWTLPALTIRQPWAWAILHAGKDLENRPWSTPYRGWFLIHAGAFRPARGYMAHLRRLFHTYSGASLPEREALDYGAAVGLAYLKDVTTADPSPWFQGPYAFVLTKARPLARPLPMKGRLGWFPATIPGWAVERPRHPDHFNPNIREY